ncbi:hypothetical protein V3C99_015853 [Haemonchus contortus]
MRDYFPEILSFGFVESGAINHVRTDEGLSRRRAGCRNSQYMNAGALYWKLLLLWIQKIIFWKVFHSAF